MVIETPRLFLREMTPEDFDALYTVLADLDIMQHYPYTFDEGRVRNWIGKNMERYRVFGFGLWAVCLKATDEMIGDCGLTMQTVNGTIVPEIGYHIAKAHQRQGYAAEAAHAVRDWTFAHTTFGTVFSYMIRHGVFLHEKDERPLRRHRSVKRHDPSGRIHRRRGRADVGIRYPPHGMAAAEK